MWGWKVYYASTCSVLILLQSFTALPLEKPNKAPQFQTALKLDGDNGKQNKSLGIIRRGSSEGLSLQKENSVSGYDVSKVSQNASLVPHSRQKRSDLFALANLIMSIIGLASSATCMGVSIANMGCNALQQPVCDLREKFTTQKEELRIVLNELNAVYQEYINLATLQDSIQQSNHDISGRLDDTVGLNIKYKEWVEKVYYHEQNVKYDEVVPGNIALNELNFTTFLESLTSVYNKTGELSYDDKVAIALSAVGLGVGVAIVGYTAYDVHVVDEVKSLLDHGVFEWGIVEMVMTGLNVIFTVVSVGLCVTSIVRTVQARNTRVRDLKGNITKMVEYAETLRQQTEIVRTLNYELLRVIDQDIDRSKNLLEALISTSSGNGSVAQFPARQALRNIDPETINKANIEEYQQLMREFIINEHRSLNNVLKDQKTVYVIREGVRSSKSVRNIKDNLELIALQVDNTFEIYSIIGHTFPNKTGYDEVINLNCIRKGIIQSQADLEEYINATQTAAAMTERHRQYINILATVRIPLELMLQTINNKFHQSFTSNDILFEIGNLDQFRDEEEYMGNQLAQYRTGVCKKSYAVSK